MSYSYEDQKQKLLTEHGIEMIIRVRDSAAALLERAGAFTVGRLIHGISGDTWLMLAAIDFLEERGEIRKVCSDGLTQNHVYKKGAA